MQKYKETIIYITAFLIAIIFVLTQVQPKVSTLISVHGELGTKKTELADLERKLETLKSQEAENAAKELTQWKKIYKPETAGMDPEATFITPFDDVIEMAKYNSIKIFSIEYIYNPPTDEFVVGAPAQYNVCQLNMQIIGDYSDLESFFKELYKYPYLINIDKLELAPYEKNKAILVGKLQLKMYSSK